MRNQNLFTERIHLFLWISFLHYISGKVVFSLVRAILCRLKQKRKGRPQNWRRETNPKAFPFSGDVLGALFSLLFYRPLKNLDRIIKMAATGKRSVLAVFLISYQLSNKGTQLLFWEPSVCLWTAWPGISEQGLEKRGQGWRSKHRCPQKSMLPHSFHDTNV